MSLHSSGSGALPEETGVVIVGAGPTGLALAGVLAANGVDAVVIDKAGQGGNTSRAAVIHARTLEVLDEIGVTAELGRRGVVVPQFVVQDRDRVLLRIPFDGLPTKFPYTLMVPQDITEQVLATELAARGGAVRWQHTLLDLQDGDRGVTVTVAGPDGTPHRIAARYVAGCDGMHSVVRERSGAASASPATGTGSRLSWPTSVVTGRTGADLLDAYDATRRPIATGVVKMTHRMTRAATAGNPLVRVVRNTAMTIAGKLPPVRPVV